MGLNRGMKEATEEISTELGGGGVGCKGGSGQRDAGSNR